MGKGGSEGGRRNQKQVKEMPDMLRGSNPLGESCWKTSAKGPGNGVTEVYRTCSGQTSKASFSGGG